MDSVLVKNLGSSEKGGPNERDLGLMCRVRIGKRNHPVIFPFPWAHALVLGRKG